MTTNTEHTEPSAEDNLSHLTEEDKNNLMSKGLLFEQLLQSEKFVSFFRMNYDLVTTDADGTMSLYLVEVPDEVALERAREEMKLNKPKAPVIVQATELDAKSMISKLGK